MIVKVIITVVYLGVVALLGVMGYKNTKTTRDYLVGGRSIHPAVMALSYGATFISTSAIVGFGGNAGVFGFSPFVANILKYFPWRIYRLYSVWQTYTPHGPQYRGSYFSRVFGKAFPVKVFTEVFRYYNIFIHAGIYCGSDDRRVKVH